MSRQIVAALILKLKDELSRDLRKHVDELKRLDQASKALGKYDKARANLARMRTEVDKTRERIREIRTAMKTADDATLGKLRGELGQAQAKANKAANAMVGDMKRVQTAIRELNAVGHKHMAELVRHTDQITNVRGNAPHRPL